MSEIEAMGHIYANAYLTIAASIANGSNDGFLRPRDNPYFSAPIPSPGGGMADVKWSFQGRGHLNSSKMVLTKSEKYKTLKSFEPLYSRGWTFQEAMLSRRTLFFSFFQPYFVCQASCRAGGDPSPEEYFNAVEMGEMFSPIAKGAASPSRYQAPGTMDLGYEWPWVAENYSSRILSVLDDKALAIGAIKDRYVKEYGEYISGSWSQNLVVDLLWSTDKRHPRTDDEVRLFGTQYCRGSIKSLPSWTWLSFDGSVRFEVIWHAFYLGKIRHIGDISTRIQVTRIPTADNFGRVTGEPLRLRGGMKRVLVIPPKGPGWQNRPQSLSCYEPKIWDDATGSYVVEVMTKSAVLEARIGEAVMDDFVVETPMRERGEMTELELIKAFDSGHDYDARPRILDCFIVAMVGGRSGNQALVTKPRGYSLVRQGDQIAYGLLLEDVPGSGGNKKRRIGLFRSNEGIGFYFDDAVETEFDIE
ncbi:uncharacterized protein DNG_04678 [Cephalotrichum gorgonifer]|uniref:Heterokaryon incompatibility domain-containing protein n=1 Tax=Cephalotrichum gorgonifer TaxID=2041049 RepID=A0AAE8MZ86_9PEZI|nr:uncharacterized protein DNG_04678 [Cephalotrichum gorgonifer]